MKIQTFSIVAGSSACNARCPFCVSKMTVDHDVPTREPEVNWRNFRIACRLAKQCGVTTAMLTGKGEPTLFTDQITKYLQALEPFAFPFIELQTNGIRIHDEWRGGHYYLTMAQWRDLGLTHIAVSIVHYDATMNRVIYLPHRQHYIDLAKLIRLLHDTGLSVRLSCILADSFIDSPRELERLIVFARENRVEQLTVRPVTRPKTSRDANTASWTDGHVLDWKRLGGIKDYFDQNGQKLMTLPHGATVYDVKGQNVCLSNCLTREPNTDEVRQLIFFPDGHLRYDWEYPGAILL